MIKDREQDHSYLFLLSLLRFLHLRSEERKPHPQLEGLMGSKDKRTCQYFPPCGHPFYTFSCLPAPADSVFVLNQEDRALHNKLMI